MNALRTTWQLIKETFSEWWDAEAPRLGAALSYYTVFALAPVLILVIAVAGLFLGPEAAQGHLKQQLIGLIGEQAASIVQTMLSKTASQGGGVLATVIGALTVLIGATGVLVELQNALDRVWKVVPKRRGWKRALKERVVSLALILSLGFLMLVSLVLSAALAAFGELINRWLPDAVVLAHLVSQAVTLLVIAGFFATIFKVLPDAKIAWRDVWVGSFATSVLFQAGKFLIGLYLGKASVASTFGAAGSLAILLVWIYYSSQIVLLGAEFTRVYANRFGSHVQPADDATEQHTQ